MEVNEILEKTRKSLERVQTFNTGQLPRERALGEAFAFAEAVEPAERIKRLFQQIPIQYLNEFPDRPLTSIREHADSFYSILQQILDFTPQQADPVNARQNLINSLKSQYEGYFAHLAPHIAYASSRVHDFSAMEREARAAMQSVQDRANDLTAELERQQSEAQRILDEVRQVAAEQGVSQQAVYFKEEADRHQSEAETWQLYTICTATGLGLFAILSLFIHEIPILTPDNTYKALQLTLSKFLIFAVIGYMLVLCARNFLSHKHNAIVNKHRQNALLTFNALSDAARGEDKRDIVLTYAASCIFSPQDTGYTKSAGNQDGAPMKLIEVLPKLSSSSGTTG
ncbi:MAG TPA: hypothetical protein VEZ16_10630 [Microvirga sp.]|nr:hypothetical protein [Microvirga sp.]